MKRLMTLLVLASALGCTYNSGRKATEEANNFIVEAQREEKTAIEADQNWTRIAIDERGSASKLETAKTEDLLKIRTEIQSANHHYGQAITSYQQAIATIAKSRGKAPKLSDRKGIEARISEFKDRIETNTMTIYGIEKLLKSRGVEVENAMQAATR